MSVAKVQNSSAVDEIRTLYVRFKHPVGVGNLVVAAPVDLATRILWVTDAAHNSWLRAGPVWWANITAWTPDITVGVEGTGDVYASEFSGVARVDPVSPEPQKEP